MKSSKESARGVLNLLSWTLILAAVLWAAGCQRAPTPSGKASPGAKSKAAAAPGGQESSGLRIKLSEPGDDSASRTAPLPQASAVPLSPDQVKAVLARLPAMAGLAADRKDFALR